MVRIAVTPICPCSLILYNHRAPSGRSLPYTIMKNPKYFELTELLKSETAVTYGIENLPTWEIVETLKRFASNTLDPIRIKWGQALIVSSGYRIPELNIIVGGSVTSDHQEGLAVDLKLPSWSKRKLSELFHLIQAMVESGEINIDQVIYYRKKKIIHIGAGEKLRKQFVVK